MSERKVCVITGGTSGIGRCTAEAMKNAGFEVYELSRRETGLPGFHHIVTDVSDENAVNAAVGQVIEEAGHIDVLINNAGFGISGAVEFTDLKSAKRQFDVNFFGMVNMNKAVLPYMRGQGRGRIVTVSSVAAPIPIPFQAFYSASKAAINAYSMALANEVKPFGITVCVVQPGDISTGFTDAREKLHDGDDVYGGRIGRGVAAMERDERKGMKPETAGRFVCRVAQKKGHKPVYTIGFAYKAACLAVRLLPARFANFVVGKLYN